MKSWLKDENIKIYSIHNGGKSLVAKHFIRNLKKKTYKYITAISKYVYINRLPGLVKEYHYNIHKIITMKHIDIKPKIWIYFLVEFNTKSLSLMLPSCLNSKIKKIFAKGYTPNWPGEIFII